LGKKRSKERDGASHDAEQKYVLREGVKQFIFGKNSYHTTKKKRGGEKKGKQARKAYKVSQHVSDSKENL